MVHPDWFEEKLRVLLDDERLGSTHRSKAKQLWLGYSGGLDSTVLLHLASQSRYRDSVKAIHINHQLSANADSWQCHCQHVANELGIPLSVSILNITDCGKGLESAAREARMQVFKKLVQDGGSVLLAHHADDQAETMLFRLFRGAGVKGLTAIPTKRPIGNGELIRPLIGISRREIEAYAGKYGLRWVEDESNQEAHFDRNYIRHSVIPPIVQRWPKVLEQITKSAAHFTHANALLVEYATEDLARCDCRNERLGQSLCLSSLLVLSKARRWHVLRTWFDQLGYLAPGVAHLTEIEKLISAAKDAQPEVLFGDGKIRRFHGRVYCIPRVKLAPAKTLSWNTQAALDFDNGSQLSAEKADEGLLPGSYEIRFRLGGERCRPFGRKHSQTLKKLLQEYNLEPWLRGMVPILYKDDEIAAVGDLWVCDSFYVNRQSSKVSGPCIKPKWIFKS